MLRAMIQLAPRPETTADGVDPALTELRAVAEFPEPGEQVYIITSDSTGTLTATAREVDERSRFELPFRRPAGPRSPQVGPVMKRSYNAKEKAVGPKPQTLKATLAHFEKIAASTAPVATVYRDALAALGPGTAAEKVGRLVAVLENMPVRGTVFFAVGSPPGNNADYARHLLDVIRGELYGIDDSAPTGTCPVCGAVAPLGATALKGAKINFLNSDDQGVFPGLDIDRAGARFSLCASCADAIASCYIQRKDELRAVIAGIPALVLPFVLAPGDAPEAHRGAADVLHRARRGEGTATAESDLLADLAEEHALAAFHILWATAGDSLDDVTGFLTDIPCTRLAALSKIHRAANQWADPVFPARKIAAFDLHLSLAGEILRHPGGERTKRRSGGAGVRGLRQRIAQAVYLKTRLDPRPLLREIRDILADHLVDPTVDDRFLAWNLTHEPAPPKKAGIKPLLNAATWIRHVALFLHYLRHLEVLEPMAPTERFAPRSDRFQKLLGPASGVDSDAKMFAFFVGALFGWLLILQGAKGVNVRSNALTWLRRGTLAGGDLPGLYVRIREKFQEYGAEAYPAVREAVVDTSALGARLGTAIPLDTDTTMYFLFLGQALAGEVFGKDEANLQEKAPS
jgi:CRISPR-associated protein Csh1